MSKTHKLTGVHQVATYECGSCSKEFDDSGQDELGNAFPHGPAAPGDEIDCPHCGEELSIEEDDETFG